MNSLYRRYALFLGGCIPLRIILAYIAYVSSAKILQYMGYIAILPAIGFIYIFLTGARKTGAETGGAPIWWNDIRPIHAGLYLAFAYLAVSGDKLNAWKFLAADVALGLSAFLAHHVFGAL